MLNPFLFFRRTERPDRTGTNKVLFDGDGQHCCRWRWTPVAHQHAVVVSWHAQKVTIVCTDLAGEAPEILGRSKSTVFLPRNGTNDHEQPRSVPRGSTRSNS